MNGEVSKVFRHIKAHGDQPGRELMCIPSGLATFTPFALRLNLYLLHRTYTVRYYLVVSVAV